MKGKRRIIFILLFIILSLTLTKKSQGAIIVFDNITVKGNTVMVKALTKGRFFPSGGEIVEFILNGKRLGRTLSGGDGFAFFEIKPDKTGLYEIIARRKGEESKGYLLVCNKGDKLFFIEVETALMGSLFSATLRSGARTVIQSLMKNFRVVYVTGLLGLTGARRWLTTKNLPNSVIVESFSEDYIKELHSMGLIPYAMVGSPEFLGVSEELVEKRFSFIPAEGAIEVKDWNELRKKLYNKNKR